MVLKKSLIYLILGTVALVTSNANAVDVKVSGVVKFTVESSKATSGSKSLGANLSKARVNFYAEEKLTNGLTVFSNVRFDGEDSSKVDNYYAGVKGNFGSIKVGDLAGGPIGLAEKGGDGNDFVYTQRPTKSHGIQYSLPGLVKNLKAEVAYYLAKEDNKDNAKKAFYNDTKNKTTSKATGKATPVANASRSNDNSNAIVAGASYDLMDGKLQLAGGYARTLYNYTKQTVNSWLGGASYSLNDNISIGAQYGQATLKSDGQDSKDDKVNTIGIKGVFETGPFGVEGKYYQLQAKTNVVAGNISKYDLKENEKVNWLIGKVYYKLGSNAVAGAYYENVNPGKDLADKDPAASNNVGVYYEIKF